MYIEKINVITKSFSKECLIIINNVTDDKESRIICHLKENAVPKANQLKLIMI